VDAPMKKEEVGSRIRPETGKSSMNDGNNCCTTTEPEVTNVSIIVVDQGACFGDSFQGTG
jgi:hypothetical protein